MVNFIENSILLVRTVRHVIKSLQTIRKCPDPTLIERFLQQNTGFMGKIDAEDRICYACYKAHLVIININNTNKSSDQDLLVLIEHFKREVKNGGGISSQEQAVTHAVYRSAILVGETLLEQNAILLPDVFDIFESIYNTISQGIVQQHSLHSIANPTWLPSQLSALLEQHMSYRCSVKKYGTVLYRYGGDLLHALNVSLGQSRSKRRSESKSDATQQHARFQQNHSIENIDISSCIAELDPDLWRTICLITQPLSSKALSSTNGSHIRQMRRFFCACCLLYTTNSQCSFPLHTLIADVVLTCGGSSRLVKFLNRLGICTSA